MSVDGDVKLRWEEIDLNSDLSWAHPADPALVAFAIEQSSGRTDVDPEEVSASQLEKGIRQLYLEATREFYLSLPKSISSIIGTMKHSMINTERPGFVTETRLLFEEDGVRYGSAKCDTFHVPSRKLVDLKNLKWYAIESMIKEGMLTAKPGYAFQTNLFRVLMQKPENQEILFEKYDWLRPEHLDVKIMQLTCVPADLNWQNKKSALKLTPYPEIVPIIVPFIPDHLVLETYKKKYWDLSAAHKTGYAPLCSPQERWEKEGGFPLRCAQYCPVLDFCRQLSSDAGEKHPLDLWEEKPKTVKPTLEKPKKKTSKKAA